MKLLFLGGNMARDLVIWLNEQGEDVVFREDKINLEDIKQVHPEFIISYNYKYIIPKEIIDYVRGNAVNLHISLLPYNRGSYPNVFSFLEDMLKGVTIHYIDEGIDTGDIIVQKEVFIDEEKETLKSSYEILHKEIQELFKKNWEKIKTGVIKAKKQTGGGANTTIGTLNSLSLLSDKKGGTLQLENLRSNIRIRAAVKEDMDDLFMWIRDSDVRKKALTGKEITYEDHKTWFDAKTRDPNTKIYIAHIGSAKIGSFRVELKGTFHCVSVVMNPEFRGKGLGRELIRIGTLRAISEMGIDCLKAEIKHNNIASIKAFEASGYRLSYLVYEYRPK